MANGYSLRILRKCLDATLLSNKLQILSEMFPMLDVTELPTLLQSNNMDVQRTIDAILGVSGTLNHFPFFLRLSFCSSLEYYIIVVLIVVEIFQVKCIKVICNFLFLFLII